MYYLYVQQFFGFTCAIDHNWVLLVTSHSFVFSCLIQPSPVNNIMMTIMLILHIPQLFNSIGFILVQPTSLEFSIAQSPVHARGVMLRLCYAFGV